jgi:hypothetical protein
MVVHSAAARYEPGQKNRRSPKGGQEQPCEADYAGFAKSM